MGLDINFLAIDHPDVASYIRKFMSSIFAIIAKALNYAIINDDMYAEHSLIIRILSAKSGFSKLHRPLYQKTGLELYKILTLLIIA